MNAVAVKGGVGSGYHAPHYGRRGQRGGSATRGEVSPDAPGSNADRIPVESLAALQAWAENLDKAEHIETDPPANPQYAVIARRVAAEAIKAEPIITKQVQKAVDNSRGRLEGLDRRLKSETSLARKIETWIAKYGSAEAATEMVMDAVRYTVVQRPESFVVDTLKIVNGLESQGHGVVDIRNHLDNPKYKGYHVWLETPAGFQYEIQFHTQDTWQGREKAHILYERFRRIPKSNVALRDKLGRAMTEIWGKIGVPTGWNKLPGSVVRW